MTFSVFHFEMSGNVSKERHFENIKSIKSQNSDVINASSSFLSSSGEIENAAHEMITIKLTRELKYKIYLIWQAQYMLIFFLPFIPVGLL